MRRSPGQPKIPRRPTASDRARRQRTRLNRTMQATQIDQEPLVTDVKASEPAMSLATGNSGQVNDIGESTTEKLSIQEYNEKIKLDKFAVSDQPQFLEEEDEDTDVDQVQRKFGKLY